MVFSDGGAGGGTVPPLQISKPEKESASSLVQVMVEPAATCTPSGPVLPQYLLPFTVRKSYAHSWSSTLNTDTDSVTASCAVMEHCWLLL
jgi:hypothetical protein